MGGEIDFSSCQAFKGEGYNLCEETNGCKGEGQLETDAGHTRKNSDSRMTQTGARIFIAKCRKMGCKAGDEFEKMAEYFPVNVERSTPLPPLF